MKRISGKPKVEFVEVDFNEKDMEELVKIRYEVFVYEQKVDPDQEIDSFEMESKHFGLKYNGWEWFFWDLITDFRSICWGVSFKGEKTICKAWKDRYSQGFLVFLV